MKRVLGSICNLPDKETVTGRVDEALYTQPYTPNAVVKLLPQYFCQDHGVRSVTHPVLEATWYNAVMALAVELLTQLEQIGCVCKGESRLDFID